jgi:cyclopropane-fatty-acyl-phospholipid synthase
MERATRRLDGMRELLAHVREKYGTDLGFVLWDGSTVPADLAPNAFAAVLADEGIVAALRRPPTLDTLLNLWVSARIDLRNGTVFDVMTNRPRVRTREFRRNVDKRLLLRVLWRFLRVPRGGPWPLENVRGDRARMDGSEAANRENVQYHYDLSNAFYALFLDPEMVYTCAYYTDWSNDLATAQRDKLDITCRKLRLQPGESFLDIGCGWGALVCYAARNYGVRAHGVTLAREQYDYAKAKVARLGLQDRVTIELHDYALLEGQFDKIASIGMFEQVGIANHPTYFQTIHRLLKPRGLYMHHAIARRAKHSEREFNRRQPGYVALTRYIFPGGEVDHLGMSIANLERYGFEVRDVEGWREHYQRTCKAWHDRLEANRAAAVREVGEVKTRLWLVYLAACSLGFEGGSISVFQTLAVKRERGASGLPPTRADLYRPAAAVGDKRVAEERALLRE